MSMEWSLLIFDDALLVHAARVIQDTRDLSIEIELKLPRLSIEEKDEQMESICAWRQIIEDHAKWWTVGIKCELMTCVQLCIVNWRNSGCIIDLEMMKWDYRFFFFRQF